MSSVDPDILYSSDLEGSPSTMAHSRPDPSIAPGSKQQTSPSFPDDHQQTYQSSAPYEEYSENDPSQHAVTLHHRSNDTLVELFKSCASAMKEDPVNASLLAQTAQSLVAMSGDHSYRMSGLVTKGLYQHPTGTAPQPALLSSRRDPLPEQQPPQTPPQQSTTHQRSLFDRIGPIRTVPQSSSNSQRAAPYAKHPHRRRGPGKKNKSSYNDQ
ncbi:hypothetical protein BJ508DRAFT_328971 [Ascobolus immersus RN42]|uniref:Uncharacterized protein n=1 Tax=Ascobolus immersus RN42 TaxID=1160509 RepID=A0A3N4I3H4_ASCIM|nr:hypothetical protein BJ508DRAFT_328971 [Ascobolus immersus RN42]